MDDDRDMVTIERSEYNELVVNSFLYKILADAVRKTQKQYAAERVLLRKESKEE